MKITIRESERSTAARPLFVWHVFAGRGRALALGIAGSQAQAELEASAAVARLRREAENLPLIYPWRLV